MKYHNKPTGSWKLYFMKYHKPTDSWKLYFMKYHNKPTDSWKLYFTNQLTLESYTRGVANYNLICQLCLHVPMGETEG